MENTIIVKNEYNSLDKLYNFLKKESAFETLKEYDIWEVRTDSNGQMEKCIVLKKSNMHAVKVFFVKENVLKINHIIPNKIMQTYFGKSVKAYKNIIEIITGKIKEVILAPAQKKAFLELEEAVKKAVA